MSNSVLIKIIDMSSSLGKRQRPQSNIYNPIPLKINPHQDTPRFKPKKRVQWADQTFPFPIMNEEIDQNYMSLLQCTRNNNIPNEIISQNCTLLLQTGNKNLFYPIMDAIENGMPIFPSVFEMILECAFYFSNLGPQYHFPVFGIFDSILRNKTSYYPYALINHLPRIIFSFQQIATTKFITNEVGSLFCRMANFIPESIPNHLKEYLFDQINTMLRKGIGYQQIACRTILILLKKNFYNERLSRFLDNLSICFFSNSTTQLSLIAKVLSEICLKIPSGMVYDRMFQKYLQMKRASSPVIMESGLKSLKLNHMEFLLTKYYDRSSLFLNFINHVN